jgi:predicted Zn finger-like uncharacterized protein
MAMVRLTCPECDEAFKAGAAPAPGKKVRCPACKHAFVPTLDDDEDESEEQPRGKAKTTAIKANAAPARKRRPDDEDEDEDDDGEDDDVPAKKKKKKKKAGAGAVLYWVYRGVSVLILLVLVGVLAWILFIRKPVILDRELVVAVAPTETQYRTIDAISKSQEVKISAKAISGQFDIQVFLEKDQTEVEGAMLRRQKTGKILDSGLNTKEADLKIQVPANESAVIRLSSGDGKKTEVKLKITN